MAEEQVVIAPHGSCELRGGNKGSDEGLSTTELFWRIPGVDVINLRASWDTSEVIHVVGVSLSDSCGELELWNGSKAQLPWEFDVFFIGAFLGKVGHVRKTHCLNIVCSCVKAGPKKSETRINWVRNMVTEVISEEIQAVLTINRVHSREVGRVDTVSEQLYAHAWDHKRTGGTDWSSS